MTLPPCAQCAGGTRWPSDGPYASVPALAAFTAPLTWEEPWEWMVAFQYFVLNVLVLSIILQLGCRTWSGRGARMGSWIKSSPVPIHESLWGGVALQVCPALGKGHQAPELFTLVTQPLAALGEGLLHKVPQ